MPEHYQNHKIAITQHQAEENNLFPITIRSGLEEKPFVIINSIASDMTVETTYAFEEVNENNSLNYCCTGPATCLIECSFFLSHINTVDIIPEVNGQDLVIFSFANLDLFPRLHGIIKSLALENDLGCDPAYYGHTHYSHEKLTLEFQGMVEEQFKNKIREENINKSNKVEEIKRKINRRFTF